MIETKDGDKVKEQGGKKSKNAKKEGEKCNILIVNKLINDYYQSKRPKL